MSEFDEIEKLHKLKEKSIITEGEFESEKRRLLNEKLKKEKTSKVTGTYNLKMLISVFMALIFMAVFSERINNENELSEVNQIEKTESKLVINKKSKEDLLEEKKLMRDKILEYEESYFFTSWNELLKSLGQGEFNKSREHAKKSLNSVEKIVRDLDNVNWCKTGEFEFDEKCKVLKNKLDVYYYSKQVLLQKLLVWFDDINSPEKMNESTEASKEVTQKYEEYNAVFKDFMSD